MLAPIALYPDGLLADILMAATYPLDVVQAARWVQDPQNAAPKGDQLFAALQQKSWDPSVKSLASFPRILRMLDANLEWTEQLGEAYLADPSAVMDGVQRLRGTAQAAGSLVTQEIVRTQPESTPIEETSAIEAASPAVVYVPICDPSLAYGPWPYPGYPPFFPVLADASIGECGWVTGQIIAPFGVLNFRTRHIEIDRKRLALLDRDREMDHDRPLREEWRHDPGHRGNVPYRDPAVSALFGPALPGTNFNPALRGPSMSPSRVAGPFAVPLPQHRSGIEGARPLLGGGQRWSGAIRAVPEGSSTASVQRGIRGVQPALEGVDPTGGGTPAAQALNPDMETKLLIDRGLRERVPAAALAPRVEELRVSPALGGAGSTRSLRGGGSLRPSAGVGVLPFGDREPGAIGAQPFSRGVPLVPFGGLGAAGRGGG
jgi:hypothetical protein